MALHMHTDVSVHENMSDCASSICNLTMMALHHHTDSSNAMLRTEPYQTDSCMYPHINSKPKACMLHKCPSACKGTNCKIIFIRPCFQRSLKPKRLHEAYTSSPLCMQSFLQRVQNFMGGLMNYFLWCPKWTRSSGRSSQTCRSACFIASYSSASSSACSSAMQQCYPAHVAAALFRDLALV